MGNTLKVTFYSSNYIFPDKQNRLLRSLANITGVNNFDIVELSMPIRQELRLTLSDEFVKDTSNILELGVLIGSITS